MIYDSICQSKSNFLQKLGLGLWTLKKSRSSESHYTCVLTKNYLKKEMQICKSLAPV